MALWIAIAASPIALVGVSFLHAARFPQWVWAFSDRTQIVWLASLLLGVAIIPMGVPVALWYLLKIRPVLTRIEAGNMAGFVDGSSS